MREGQTLSSKVPPRQTSTSLRTLARTFLGSCPKFVGLDFSWASTDGTLVCSCRIQVQTDGALGDHSSLPASFPPLQTAALQRQSKTCRSNVPTLLPEGAKLEVVAPTGVSASRTATMAGDGVLW